MQEEGLGDHPSSSECAAVQAELVTEGLVGELALHRTNSAARVVLGCCTAVISPAELQASCFTLEQLSVV